jgi:hypothetical protein
MFMRFIVCKLNCFTNLFVQLIIFRLYTDAVKICHIYLCTQINISLYIIICVFFLILSISGADLSQGL